MIINIEEGNDKNDLQNILITHWLMAYDYMIYECSGLKFDSFKQKNHLLVCYKYIKNKIGGVFLRCLE